MNVFHKLLTKATHLRCCRRAYSQKPAAASKKLDKKSDPSLVRNIGILAHIDAGKTTTTERMLFFSGTINSMGEVHKGNTVTDFMDQERERGITITAASVTFPWDKHTINLLDTPGHIDFTMEVEQTLNVMDGAIIVLDGSAGVEAQTITVWRQAERYGIPRLIYINKMDRPEAVFFQNIQSVEAKLRVTPVVLQTPYFNDSKNFRGVIDLIEMECYEWDPSSLGMRFTKKKLTQDDGEIWEKAMKKRIRLSETLIRLDDELVELILKEEENSESLSPSRIKSAVRKVTESRLGVPILCGSSYKNIGVQLLMDAIIQYLPSPVSNKSTLITKCFGNHLCARAFKIRHDKFRGPITFVRIYSGSLSPGDNIYNMRLGKTEHCNKVMVAYADDYEESNFVGTGNIAAVTGLQTVQVGDLITSTATVASNAMKQFESVSCKVTKDQVNEIFTVGALIPDPVFFCSIEAPSSKLQSRLDQALVELQREDPSFRVETNPETCQTVMAGMGELHLEVIKDRIRKEYDVDADIGPMQIAYKEKLIKPVRNKMTTHSVIGKVTHSVRADLTVMPRNEDSKEIFVLDKSKDSIENLSSIYPKQLVAIKHGIETAFMTGPKLCCPVINAQVMLHWFEAGKGTAETMITSAFCTFVRKLIKSGGTKLYEPLMFVSIVCPIDMLPAVLNDLGRRRALVDRTDLRGTERVVEALIPLSELLGYASHLRILTSGQASFTMEFQSYEEMTPEAEAAAIKATTGFDPLE